MILAGFIVGFCFGPGPTTYAILPELFDQPSKPAALSISSSALWFSFAVVGVVVPYMFVSCMSSCVNWLLSNHAVEHR